jgi:hypothetical protein
MVDVVAKNGHVIPARHVAAIHRVWSIIIAKAEENERLAELAEGNDESGEGAADTGDLLHGGATGDASADAAAAQPGGQQAVGGRAADAR